MQDVVAKEREAEIDITVKVNRSLCRDNYRAESSTGVGSVHSTAQKCLDFPWRFMLYHSIRINLTGFCTEVNQFSTAMSNLKLEPNQLCPHKYF